MLFFLFELDSDDFESNQSSNLRLRYLTYQPAKAARSTSLLGCRQLVSPSNLENENLPPFIYWLGCKALAKPLKDSQSSSLEFYGSTPARIPVLFFLFFIGFAFSSLRLVPLRCPGHLALKHPTYTFRFCFICNYCLKRRSWFFHMICTLILGANRDAIALWL